MALCTVSQAAAALGVSVASVRRGIKTGRYPARQQPTVQGYTWLVELPDEQVAGARVPEHRVAAAHVPDAQVPDSRVPPDAPQEPSGGALASQRAADMAEYSHRLLAPYIAQIAELSQTVGRLEAELEQARAAQATAQQSAPSPGWEARRWWQRLLWG